MLQELNFGMTSNDFGTSGERRKNALENDIVRCNGHHVVHVPGGGVVRFDERGPMEWTPPPSPSTVQDRTTCIVEASVFKKNHTYLYGSHRSMPKTQSPSLPPSAADAVEEVVVSGTGGQLPFFWRKPHKLPSPTSFRSCHNLL